LFSNKFHEIFRTDSEESESQSEAPKSTRQSTRKQPQKQPNQSTRSRKQSQPQNRQQQQQQRNREENVQPPRRPQANAQEPPLLRNIRMLQAVNENNIIPRAPFGRLIKEIIQSHGDFRITKEAFDVLKEALETYLVELFEDSYRLALHRKRVTLVPADMKLVLYLRGTRDPGYSASCS
jgi:histone H3/H4